MNEVRRLPSLSSLGGLHSPLRFAIGACGGQILNLIDISLRLCYSCDAQKVERSCEEHQLC